MQRVSHALCALASAPDATTAVHAEQPSPQPMPNGAQVPPGASHTRAFAPRMGNGSQASTLGPAATSTRDVGDFPRGLARYVDLDRSARGECVHGHYEAGRARR